MGILNDKTIFKYLEPFGNEKISVFSGYDFVDFLNYLDKYYLEYRNILGIDESITFGIEIEIDNFKGKVEDLWPFELEINKLVGNNNWIVKNDLTLKWGREIASEILRDNEYAWRQISNVCNFVSNYGEIKNTCASHVHIGSQYFGDNPLYWYRLFKLWSVYENVIYRFCYGEYLTHRDNILEYAKPVADYYDKRLLLVQDKLDSCGLLEMLYDLKPEEISIDYLKKQGISYWHMLADNNYDLYDFNKCNDGCTVEYRPGNGTLDEIIWQNKILFFSKLMSYCKSDKYDLDIINRRRNEVCGIFSNLDEYSKVYLEQGIELCDMIFDKNIDKIYFLRQYLKSFYVVDKPFVKGLRFTCSKI